MVQKILLGRSHKGVFATRDFPKAGDISIQGWFLSEDTVEKYLFFDKGYAGVITEIAGEPETIALDMLLPTFQPTLTVYGSGKTYHTLEGTPGADSPKVLFKRLSDKMVQPYGYIDHMPKETSKLTAEAELAILCNKDNKVVGYAYGGDPTTRELHGEEEKSGIKSGAYPVSFAILTEDNKPLDLPLTYSFKGQDLDRQFNCIVHYTGGNKGLYLTEQALVDYLVANDVKGMTVQGPAMLLAGNPADASLRVENDADIGDNDAQATFAEKMVQTLDTGVTQSALLGDFVAFSMQFQK
ncbi:MAG: hypothetical protein JW812_03225 [Alphaproteobacteria bacterium]|nr:hypothetical protein [Alphaproteobacteria bacterium]MBN2779820.1 hypothetical protein [Alphaproteobacteria bacterium]